MVVSMWIGNLMLLVINLPLIGLWVALLRVPYRLLYPAILLFCCIGLLLGEPAARTTSTSWPGFGIVGTAAA